MFIFYKNKFVTILTVGKIIGIARYLAKYVNRTESIGLGFQQSVLSVVNDIF